jgi:hypothetical protein
LVLILVIGLSCDRAAELSPLPPSSGAVMPADVITTSLCPSVTMPFRPTGKPPAMVR